MSSTSVSFGARKPSDGLRRVMQPLDAWSQRRTVSVALALGVLVFVLGLQVWRTSDASHLDATRAAWVAAQTKLRDTGRIAAELPDLRARAAAGRLQPENWSAADALRAVAELAAQSGLRVAGIEPVAMKGADANSLQPFPQRTLKLRADGAFGEMQRFLEALAGLPRLVVPENLQIRRQADALGIEATLRIFDTLPAVASTAAPRPNPFVVDPFGDAGIAAQAGDMLLVGTLVGRRRAMALLQSGRDVDGFAPGQKVGDERIGRIVPRAVELARHDGGSRKLTFAEDRK